MSSCPLSPIGPCPLVPAVLLSLLERSSILLILFSSIDAYPVRPVTFRLSGNRCQQFPGWKNPRNLQICRPDPVPLENLLILKYFRKKRNRINWVNHFLFNNFNNEENMLPTISSSTAAIATTVRTDATNAPNKPAIISVVLHDSNGPSQQPLERERVSKELSEDAQATAQRVPNPITGETIMKGSGWEYKGQVLDGKFHGRGMDPLRFRRSL